ncbi:MAG: hypothetical protein LBC40_03110, partial [Dysgonamonadaceae bacterium]|nr:hypothetical protein [Dysgonamonadaceae bacterium]
MKRKITKLLMTMLLAIVAAWSVQAAEFTVTSQGDDGTEGSGTLRDLITNKTGSNTIIIPEGYVITVSDTIAIASKGITIIGEGAGATVQVTTPGTSPWRIFSIIAGASVRTITLKNLTLKGGSTSIGGIISFDRRVNLTIENCTLSDGNASNNGGALGASLTGDITVSIKKSIFKNNHGSKGAAIGLSSGEVEITGCYFKENIGVVGTNTNGRTFSA